MSSETKQKKAPPAVQATPDMELAVGQTISVRQAGATQRKMKIKLVGGDDEDKDFVVGEKVLACSCVDPEPDLIYVGTVLEVDDTGPIKKCRVHFTFWAEKFDEELYEENIMKMTVNNVRKKLRKDAADDKIKVDAARKEEEEEEEARKEKEVAKQRAKTKKSAKTRVAGDKKTSKAGKRKLPGGMEENGKAKRPKAAQLTLDLSPSLQRLLLQNWEQVECHDSVVPLPHRVDVENILQMYLESEQAEQLGSNDEKKRFQKSILLYFNKSLDKLLLYDKERAQLASLKNDHGSKPMSKLYGVEHLVRLLVKMPELVSYVNVGDGELTRIRKQLTAFEGFLAINANTLWTTEYERIE